MRRNPQETMDLATCTEEILNRKFEIPRRYWIETFASNGLIKWILPKNEKRAKCLEKVVWQFKVIGKLKVYHILPNTCKKSGKMLWPHFSALKTKTQHIF